MTIIANDSDGIARYLLVDSSGRLNTLITDGTTTAAVSADNRLRVRSSIAQYCYCGDHTEAQTNTVIITPTAGKKILIKNAYVSTESVDVNVTLKFTNNGHIFFKLYTSKTQAAASAELSDLGGTDATVDLTCGAGTFVTIAYEEV